MVAVATGASHHAAATRSGFIAGLAHHPMTALFGMTGAINRVAFETSIERVMVPEPQPGGVVIMALSPAKRASAGAISSRRPVSQCSSCRPSARTTPASRRFAPSARPAYAKRPPAPPEPRWNTSGELSQTFTPEACAKDYSAAEDDPNR